MTKSYELGSNALLANKQTNLGDNIAGNSFRIGFSGPAQDMYVTNLKMALYRIGRKRQF